MLNAQADQWTFVKGNIILPSQPIYGLKGIGNVNNQPGKRTNGTSWTDNAGNLWLFGGDDYDLRGSLNDLWKYNILTDEWTWMKGDSSKAVPGVYGEKNISHESNNPGSRYGALSWVDYNGNLWLFGGYGVAAADGLFGYLNDLWKYDIITNNWIWMNGSKSVNVSNTYGKLNEPASTNVPGARTGASGWTDSVGNLILFGGQLVNVIIQFDYNDCNDMWRYDIASNEWTWIGGNNFSAGRGNYGIQGMAKTDNLPCARSNAVTWKDTAGCIWLFGGRGKRISGLGREVNDLWRFDMKTNLWTWMKGDTVLSQEGVYGTQGVATMNNKPGARQGSMGAIDSAGNLWLFGGFVYGGDQFEDIWKYDISKNEWTWLKGKSFYGNNSRFGVKGIPDPLNTPGRRADVGFWGVSQEHLWLFGSAKTNDLWKYSIPKNDWTWVKGDSTNAMKNPSNYGTKGKPSKNNDPGFRYSSVTWQDFYGNVWVFGDGGNKNDLWKYDTKSSEWTWLKGDSSGGYYVGVYGQKGVSHPLNIPGTRTGATGWTDKEGNLWLFGGEDYNDLWKYEVLKNEWIWVNGENERKSSYSIYGTKGVAHLSNRPGSRIYSTAWTDNNGNLWLFGGTGFARNSYGALNDLWRYDISSNLWTWVNGDDVPNIRAVYEPFWGSLRRPGARDGATGWKDKTGNLWLFGGLEWNDLWKYEIASNQWTWIKGSPIEVKPGVYGIRGKPDTANTPGGRYSAISWQDKRGNFWLLGGKGMGSNFSFGFLNDLWRYNNETNQWTWMAGDNKINSNSSFYKQGGAETDITPGSRFRSIAWLDQQEKLWLFNGYGLINYSEYYLNELWYYTPPVNQKPVVKITSPTAGDVYPVEGEVIMNVEASDLDGAVVKVEFYNRNNKFGEDSIAPYSFTGSGIDAGTYILTAKATDNEGAISISDSVMLTINSCSATGLISADGYVNIGGSTITDLLSNPKYPNQPDLSVFFNQFEYGYDLGSNYGARVRGYICAPETGIYYFFLASDDQSELWLSSNSNPINKRKIAFLDRAVFPRAWQSLSTQKSGPISLIKGGKYYIETLHKEGIGLDHLSVAWLLPSNLWEAPIPGNRLSPWQTSNTANYSNMEELKEKLNSVVPPSTDQNRFSVTATPNPTSSYFTIRTKSNSANEITIVLADVLGRVVEKKSGIAPNSIIQLGNKLESGVYFVEVIQGDQRRRFKLFKN